MYAVSYRSRPTLTVEQTLVCPHFLCRESLLCHTPTAWCKCCSHHNNTCDTIHRFHYRVSSRQTISHIDYTPPPACLTNAYTPSMCTDKGSAVLFLFKCGRPKCHSTFLSEVIDIHTSQYIPNSAFANECRKPQMTYHILIKLLWLVAIMF